MTRAASGHFLSMSRSSVVGAHLPAPFRVARRYATRQALRSAALPIAAHLVPSVLVLGQWWPERAPTLRALPGGLCRWRGPDTGRREVSLTFDDGPSAEVTEGVLDLLDGAQMKSTFFCLGEQVDLHPDLVGEIRQRGHEIGVHGYRHQPHLLRTATQIANDLAAGVAALDRLGAEFHPRYFRPPYGQVSGGSIVAAHKENLEMVLWSAWGREWADPSPESVARRVIDRLDPGAIVLLHDSEATSPAGTGERVLAALRLVIENLESQEMTSVTLSELIRR